MNAKISLKKYKDVTSPSVIAEILQTLLKERDETDKMKEFFYVIGLSTRNSIQYIELISMGTLTATLVHPREVFKVAIMKNSASIIIAHNHPTGETSPSEDDLKITKELADSGKILSIDVIDHIIFTEDKYKSFKEDYLI